MGASKWIGWGVALALLAVLIRDSNDVSDDLDFRYKSYGERSRPTVVFIPGLDGVRELGADLFPELTVHFHVVVFSLPLANAEFRSKGVEYTFDYIASELVSVLDELGVQKAHVIGESFGGAVAQHFALLAPQRLDKLVLVSSLARTELTPDVKVKVDYLLPAVRTVGRFLPGMAQYLFARIHVSDVMEPSDPRWLRDLFVREASWAHHASVIERVGLVLALDIRDRVPAIQHDTLVAYSSEDHFTSHLSKDLLNLLPNASEFVLTGGHLPHTIFPKKFSAGVTKFILGTPGDV